MNKHRKYIGVIKRRNYIVDSEIIICGMDTKQRQGKANKDDIISYRILID